MDDSPLVSIITIVYNGEQYIEDTIKSVINQTYRNIEYIVIDGGSTDNTINIIRKYEHLLASFSSGQDEGISDAFNKGLKLAKGQIVGIVNADDWYETDAVEKVVANIGYFDIAYGKLRLLKDGKTDFILQGDHQYLRKEMTISHPAVFVKKKCYDQFGMFDINYKCAMDYDLILRFWINNCSFIYIPNILVNMRAEGFSDKQWLLGCRETLSIKNKYLPARKFKNELYFYKHISAILLPRFLKRMRMGFIVRGYRSRISKVKKTYV